MAAITTRETGTTGVNGVTRKNLPLTNSEIDNNFINLNTKIENIIGAGVSVKTTQERTTTIVNIAAVHTLGSF